MLKSNRSFRINHEIDKKPSVHELLYDTKRVRWMKFLVIPLLIAFSLLLVLSNVNFSGESYELVVAPLGESQTIPTQTPTKEVRAIASINYKTPTEKVGLGKVVRDGGEKEDDGGEKEDDGGEYKDDDKEKEAGDAVNVASKHWDETLAVPVARSFTCTDNNSCKTVICTGGPIFNILNEFEYFLTWCGNIFYDVIIENCTFNTSTIGRYTFSGNFKMATLTIRNCQLDTIVDNAFKYQSVNKLTNITFDGVQLKVLNAQTFNGLVAVKNFKLFNVLTQATSPLNANHFLQPMAASLSNLVFQQTEESDSSKTIYEPTGWLGGNSDTVYSKLLYVDLSGTNFNNTLNGNTFVKLSAVQALRLANCSLSTITENVFTGILSTLKSLDLRYNRLQTLDAGFLATALGKGINIEFGLNLWSCDCDNVEIIEYMKQLENNSAAETVCATPMELQGIQIRNAQMRCHDTTTLTTIITAISTTTAATTTKVPTTIMTTSTAESTDEITATNPETTAISSTISNDNSTLSPATSATTVMPISTADTTEETTVSMDPTTPTSFTTAFYNSTLSTSVATTLITSVTPNNITNTTVTTSSSATTEGTDVSESTETTTYEAATSSFVTNTIETTSFITTQISIKTDSEETEESDPTHLTPPTTINATLAPTTTPNSSTIASTTTNETNAPPSSLMTSTTEGDTTMETAESIETTTQQLTSTTFIIFPGTTIIPIPTIKTTETTETTSSQATDTTEIENTTVNKNITTTTIPATIPPTSTTCFNNSSPKFLVCTDIIAIRLCDYDATFNVIPISARSVQLQIGKNANGLQAIYFQTLNNNSVCEQIDVGDNSSIVIDNLTPNGIYTFCLIPKGQTSLSPFNCRSAHLPSDTAQPWLEHSDVVLFCIIAILIIIVCVIVGVAVIYYLLRWRPTLLYGNKRLRRIASASHEVLLFPKPDRTSVDSKTHALNELSKMHSSVSDTLTPENYLNIKSYNYMQYFKNAELEKQRRVAHISLNQPPVHRAPALPPNVGGAATRRNDRVSYFSGYLPVRPLSQQSTVVLEDAPQPAHSRRGGAAARFPPEPVEVLENEYESLDYYQELY